MKKNIFFVITVFILIFANACSGYKPIFGSSNSKFKISQHSLEGDKILGNQIYQKLYNVSRSNKDNPDAQSIKILIQITKDKVATVKNNAGKILEYKINVNGYFIVSDYLINNEILNQNFNHSSSYKVQDQQSETLKLENLAIANLINQISQNLLIEISRNITAQ